MTYRVDRTRRSAKGTITDFANELLNRPFCDDNNCKLMAIQTIALRMNWTELYEKLKFRKLNEPKPVEEKWWQK